MAGGEESFFAALTSFLPTGACHVNKRNLGSSFLALSRRSFGEGGLKTFNFSGK
jgi:hypothetical protein